MAGKLAIDFGTSNTRLALWDEAKKKAVPIAIPDLSLFFTQTDAEEGEISVPYIPSLIHYGKNRILIGKQVQDGSLIESASTFRWMKRYISNRLELPRRVEGRTISYSEAGAEFLSKILLYARDYAEWDDQDVAFTAPVEAFEHFQDWLAGICETAGIGSYHILDEASAAALGYGVHIQANDVYMVFDYGGGTLDVSIVKIEDKPSGGKRCRALGKGGVDIGGSLIDQWLFQDALKRNDKTPEDVLNLSGLLLTEAERTKEALTIRELAEITVADPRTGEVITADYTRMQFEDLLEENGMFSAMQGAIDHALAQARERGFEKEHIKAVLLVGGSSLIPCVGRSLRRQFGNCVKCHRPLDAVALGAAAFIGGVEFYDHIQHDYALRYYNREKGDYDYLVIVPAGTCYPTSDPIREITVKASHEDQEFLGLDIYEIGRMPGSSEDISRSLFLVFDSNGSARLTEMDEPEFVNRFWINEKCPTFIHARPPAQKGDRRFPVQFTIDENKRLCVTVRDNKNGKVLMRKHPVIKLK
jgi:molecular chaperone DnaK (HSP70)